MNKKSNNLGNIVTSYACYSDLLLWRLTIKSIKKKKQGGPWRMSENHKENIDKLVDVLRLWKGTAGNWISDKRFTNIPQGWKKGGCWRREPMEILSGVRFHSWITQEAPGEDGGSAAFTLVSVHKAGTLWGSVTQAWRSSREVDFTSGHLQEEGRAQLLGLASSRGS